MRVIRFNDVANRAGITGFVQQMGIRRDVSGVLADIVMWFVRLITLVVAFDALGLPAVSQVLQQFLLWIPNLVVGLVIRVIAGLAANAGAQLIRGATAEAGLSNPAMLSNGARIAVWSFGIIAVNQIGVAQTFINTLFFGLVGALALARGLAFGLGGRDTASELVHTWYAQGQQALRSGSVQSIRPGTRLSQLTRIKSFGACCMRNLAPAAINAAACSGRGTHHRGRTSFGH